MENCIGVDICPRGSDGCGKQAGGIRNGEDAMERQAGRRRGRGKERDARRKAREEIEFFYGRMAICIVGGRVPRKRSGGQVDSKTGSGVSRGGRLKRTVKVHGTAAQWGG